MPRGGSNQMPGSVKKRYFELVREGHMGAAAARRVGVSTSCGSLWFLDAGGVMISDPGPISARFLDQDVRIAIADGLRAGQHKKEIAIAIGKSLQTVYREVARNSKPDGTYQPWWAHNQALRREETTQAAESFSATRDCVASCAANWRTSGPRSRSAVSSPALTRRNPQCICARKRSTARCSRVCSVPRKENSVPGAPGVSHIGVAWPRQTRSRT